MINLESKRQLVAFSELYVELGILEKLLRVAIPAILTTKVGSFQINGWITLLTLDVKSHSQMFAGYKKRWG